MTAQDSTRASQFYGFAQTAVLVAGLFLRKPTIAIGIAAAVVVLFLMVKVRFEQVLLRARYPQYGDYQRRTWGVIPGLRW